jgi:hypothetical protein
MRSIWQEISVLALGAAMAAAGEPARADSAGMPVAVAAADPFSALIGKARKSDPKKGRAVERYAIASDGRMFLVEGKVGAARLKYLCSNGDTRLDCALDPEAYAEEVFLATGARGPRGDIIYKGETGEVLLRIMSYGGATVFWPGRANGEAAAKSYGDDANLRLPPATRADALRRADLASARLSALTGARMAFELGAAAPIEGAGDDAVLADAIMRVVAGMAEVARDQTGAGVVAERINQVTFKAGGPPHLSLDGKVLKVIYDPALDAAGRPSSRAVKEFLESSL